MSEHIISTYLRSLMSQGWQLMTTAKFNGKTYYTLRRGARTNLVVTEPRADGVHVTIYRKGNIVSQFTQKGI